MKFNLSMDALLKKYAIDFEDCIPYDAYPVWHKTDSVGRVYYGIASFCGTDKHPINSDEDLSLLEWHGNEVFLDAHREEDIVEILKQAIGILLFWRRELEAKYADTSFYLFASYDNGDMLILDDGEYPIKSITMRFWTDRGENDVINLSEFDSWNQPAMIEHIISH